MRAGADLAKKNKVGNTALELAREEGHAEVAALLEQADDRGEAGTAAAEEGVPPAAP